MFNGQSVLITGGTGSFGNAFIRKILGSYNPARIVVYSRDELKQSEMEHAINDKRIHFVIGDIRDKERLTEAMQGVDFVVHAAALKHVPITERNPMECVKTNVFGGQNVIDAALQQNVKQVVSLSTDKAANPVSIYGASKLIADKLFVAANHIIHPSQTKFSIVRYGNVAGSRGSVLAQFKKIAVANKSEFPITDLRMTRFWLTVSHGVDFTIEVFQRMRGGEIFVPKVPSVKIKDLVESMSCNAQFKVIGIRPGEKIHELLITQEDSRYTIEFDGHFVIVPAASVEEHEQYIQNMKGETGKLVEEGFEYHSGTNKDFLTIEQIKELNRTIVNA